MVTDLLKKLFGSAHDREMKKIWPLIHRINALEPKMQSLSDSELQQKTPELKKRLQAGETVDQILPEAFAVCREASKRVLGMRHYDVQMIGGYILNRGSIAEMRTGEGKTLVATLPVYLNALTGRGVHVVTVNDYLAKRDCEWMGRLYNWLGLTTGTIVHGLTDQQRKEAYGADITYGTNNEFGFDYLRDNMKFDLQHYVQREHHYAIVDECDSILIDEARTPLIISGPAESSTEKYYQVNQIIPQLKRDTHFTMEEKTKTVSLTDEGNAKVEELLKIENIYDPQHIELLHHVLSGLKAHHLYRLDVEYMIKDGEIVIVDEFTGRLMPGRRWSDGLHQAIEAKEGVEVKSENQTLATITFQNYFRMYKKLSGMTGTAYTEAAEFKKIYNLDVSVIPTNRPIQRLDHNDVVYKTEQAKFRAIVKDIRERHQKGQPVLVGTASIEKSELLSRFLKQENVKHDVLNAKQHEREADIIAQAGRKGAITIATNMAGRGTDIMLGGNAEVLAKVAAGDEESESFPQYLKQFKEQVEKEKQEVIAAGGLYIVGTERHESRRIDNQLRGRSGRQGDPGASMFYLSLEDNLMRIFNGERIQKIMSVLNMPEDEPITAKMVTNSIEGAQRKVEGHNFDIRKNLIEYDDVMNQQRNAIYGMRRRALEGQDVEKTVLDMISDVISEFLDTYVPQGGKKSDWNIEALNNMLSQYFNFVLDPSKTMSMTDSQIETEVQQKIRQNYDGQKKSMGQFFHQVQKMILLQVIDQKWKEHLYVIDKLKEGINLRGYAQKDPLIEYKKEAFNAFEKLNNQIAKEMVEKIMRVQLVLEGPEAQEQLKQSLGQDESDLEDLNYSAPSDGPMEMGQGAGQAGSDGGPRNRVTMTSRPADDQKMNRADRRKMEKRGRR